jgi:hypothetical protein
MTKTLLIFYEKPYAPPDKSRLRQKHPAAAT